MSDSITEDTEIRHLPLHVREHLSGILDEKEYWTKLLHKIPSPVNGMQLYKAKHIPALKAHTDGPTMALLADWGTHGKKRPTVKTLISVLAECQLYLAADYLAIDILKGDPVPKPDLTTEIIPLPNPNQDANSSSDVIRSLSLPLWRYYDLYHITGGFNEKSYFEGGNALGSGKFSTVFLGICQNGSDVAVKRMDKKFSEQTDNEISILSRIRHVNLIKLLGYSSDGPYHCLIYEYMVNGSLQDNLARSHNKQALTMKNRLIIAHGVAAGLVCLHNNKLIHRDIKSANILLDHVMIPKLGDFGIVHIGPDFNETSCDTIKILGTVPYIPEEAYRGRISYKLDVYSFGVVLLELLSGKKALWKIENDQNDDLITYFQENCSSETDVLELLDKQVENWDSTIAIELYNISQACLTYVQQRPDIMEIAPQLEELIRRV